MPRSHGVNKGEGSDWYQDYLASDHWRHVRRAKLEQADYHCERCGYAGKPLTGDPAGGLQVHHLTYERCGSETLDGLEVLCGYCHAQEHGIVKWRDRDHWSAANTDRALKLSRYLDVDEIDVELGEWDELIKATDCV